MATLRIVVICSGNICRSPMAEELVRKRAAERGVPVVAVSCGTLGIVGQPAAENGRTAMAEIGMPIDGHRSQGVQAAMIDLADWIVVMAPRHEQFLRAHFDGLGNRLVRRYT